MSYFRASTDNPLGWRPNAIRLGDLHRGRRMVLRNRLQLGEPGQSCTGDGFCSPCDTNTDGSGQCVAIGQQSQAAQGVQLNQIAQYFQQINAEQIAQEQQIVSGNAAGIQWSPDLVTQIKKNRDDLEYWLGKYNLVYRAAFGDVQHIPGLQGLGIGPVVGGLIAAGVLAAIISACIVIVRSQSNTRAQIDVQKQQAQNQASALAQASSIQAQIIDATARGDQDTVNRLTQQYQQLINFANSNNPNPNDWGTFLQKNWGWMAASLFGIILVVRA